MYDFLPINHYKHSDLVKLFMLDMPDDDYYDLISVNLLRDDVDLTLSLYREMDLLRKSAILTGIGLLEKNEAKLLHFLMAALAEEHEKIKIAAIDALANFKGIDSEAIKPFLSPDYENIAIKCAAIRFFSKQKRLLFKENLIDFLMHEHEDIKENAIDELESLNYPNFVNDIKVCLNDESKKVREMTEDILSRSF